MAVISGELKGPMGDARVGVVIELRAVRTSASVVIQARSQSVTDATGRYTLKVEPGQYDVMITASGRQPERVGVIQVMVNSATGSLNDFLLIPGESDLNPAIVATVDQMRSEAAASAAAAKVSETNASAAMTNALSKVATAEQTVAGPVKFNNGITSLSDAVMQAKTPGANVIMRFKDAEGVEKGAIFNTVATGQMTQRWGGTAFSAIYKEDGTVTFPSDVYSGNAKFATRAIALGTKDLNTVFEEGDHYQSTSANATPARNYPNYLAGTLTVFVSRASVGSGIYVTQQYYPYKASAYFFQRVYDAGVAAWTDWESFRSQSYNDTRYVALQGVGKTFADLDAFKAWQSSQNGLTSFRLSAAVGGFPAYNPGLIWNTSDTYAMLMPYYSSSEIKCVTGNASGKYQEFFLWNTGNTTVDSNGFIKKASPIVKLFSDGTSELNDQSQGVTTEWVSEGVYRISGTLGFNADAEWGGVDGGIEIPTDRNKLPLVWVDYEVDATGDLLIKTFHRINSTAPKFAQNVKVGYKEGQPIDIPDGRWIDLRVEMPGSDEPEYVPEPEPEDDVMLEPEQPDVTEPEGGEEPAPGKSEATEEPQE